MKKNEIEVGGLYIAKVNGSLTTVRVDAIRDPAVIGGEYIKHSRTYFDVTNLKTGRKTTFRSAMKFRAKKDMAKTIAAAEQRIKDGAPGPKAVSELFRI